MGALLINVLNNEYFKNNFGTNLNKVGIFLNYIGLCFYNIRCMKKRVGKENLFSWYAARFFRCFKIILCF